MIVILFYVSIDEIRFGAIFEVFTTRYLVLLLCVFTCALTPVSAQKISPTEIKITLNDWASQRVLSRV